MSIENKIDALIAAIEANTAALGGAKKTTAAATSEAAKPKAESKPKPKAQEHTREEMQAMLTELKEATDAATAKGVISNVGGVAKMGEIPEDKIDAVYEAAKAAMPEGEGDGDDDM